ncbi:hypothetical protein BC940DRAFT_288976 [Gongronella butleri]|nr:hypothetical protein BC940DRAFT_288976 [Gongronella butleri]
MFHRHHDHLEYKAKHFRKISARSVRWILIVCVFLQSGVAICLYFPSGRRNTVSCQA